MLKQEEMKTWKKIEETKKRTGEIHNLKRRNEDKVQKVRLKFLIFVESAGSVIQRWELEDESAEQFYDLKAAAGREAQNSGSHLSLEAGGSEADQDDKAAEWAKEASY